MLELEAAVAEILRAIPQSHAEEVRLAEADGRIAAETVESPTELPGFDNSSMDGYAVRAADVSNASKEHPVRLRVIGKVPAGDTWSGEITAAACLRLFTGWPWPKGL